MKYCIIGNGFLANAFKKRIENWSWYPTEDTEVILYMGGPTHINFEKNPEYHMGHIGAIFSSLVNYCIEKNVKLVYTSSALVYENKSEFTELKKSLEDTAFKYLPNSLGLRIFPVYGEGENRTFVAKSIEAMKKGNRPIVYGDGTQKRDFVYTQDVVDQTLRLIEDGKSGVFDIGTGNQTSFNDIVAIINKELGTNIEPIFVEAPEGYDMKGIYCKNPSYPAMFSVEDGIREML